MGTKKDRVNRLALKSHRNMQKIARQQLDELVQEQAEAREPNEEQIFIEKQRVIAEALKEQAIEEFDPGYGTYDGYRYDDYIASWLVMGFTKG